MKTLLTSENTGVLENYLTHPIGPEDSQAINRMLLDIEAVDHRDIFDTLEDRQRDLNDPETNPDTDSILVMTPTGQAAAMGWIFTPKEAGEKYITFLWGEVHPQHRRRGLGNFILSWMEDRATQILAGLPNDKPHTMRVFVKHDLQDRIELYENHGFQAIRNFYRMQRDLQQPIATPDLPPGFSMTAWDASRNDEALTALNEAFSDHWGFIPMTDDLWRLWVLQHEDFRPDLSFMVLSAETGEIVGLAVNKVNLAENEARGIREGWIMALCARRPWRKRGLATALLNASMQAFQADGLKSAGLSVDTENMTGALRIYERLGFHPVTLRIALARQVMPE